MFHTASEIVEENNKRLDLMADGKEDELTET